MTYIFQNVDLSFKSRTRQGRNVNSYPPDGVDLWQLGKGKNQVEFVLDCSFWNAAYFLQ